jgi:hypothetical protein
MEVARRLATVVPRKDAEGKIDGRANEAAAKALEIAKQLYAQEQGKTTSDIIEYNAVLKQNNANGVPTPSLAEWLASQKKAGGTNINLNNQDSVDAAQFKTRSEMDKLDYEKNYAPKAQSARDMKDTLAAVSQYVDAPSGLAGVAAAELGKWSGILGTDITPQMNAAQVMQALTAKMSAAFRPVGTGSTSDYEQKLFQSAVPGLMQTPAARKQMILLANKFADRAIEEAALLRDNPGDKNLTKMRADLQAKPILSADDIKTLQQYQGKGDAAASYVPKSGDTVVNKEGKTLTFTDGVGWK